MRHCEKEIECTIVRKRLNASFDLVENVLIVLNFHVFDFKLLIIRDTDFN